MNIEKTIIEDQKETIKRLQQGCTEKTDIILKLGEKLEDLRQLGLDLQEKIHDYESENNKYCFVLQEIKAIAKGVRSYLEVPAPRDVRYEMDRILDCITKAESEVLE